jgi:tyrosine-protein phosphatase SIW14
VRRLANLSHPIRKRLIYRKNGIFELAGEAYLCGVLHARFFLLPLLLSSLGLGAGVCAPADAPSAVKRAAGSQKLHILGIRDAGLVDDFIYRGAQPNDEGLEALKKLGVDSIVDLRGERRGLIRKERAHAQSLGMRFINMPGNGWSPPPDKQIAQFFSLLRERPRRRIFIHCWLGGDRSGVFIAAYRIAFDGWTPEHALREMREFHFKAFWHPAMTRYVRDFPARLARSPLLGPFRHTAQQSSLSRDFLSSD